MLELKDKIGSFDTGAPLDATDAMPGSAKDEAISALISLGYSKSEAMMSIVGITDPGLTAEEYIRRALKQGV